MRALLFMMLISTGAWSRSPRVSVECIRPMLMMRTEAVPRSEAFNKGAEAFDKATVDWNKKRYAQAALGFMAASAFFAADGAEGNWRYAWQNAALSFEAANQVEQGKAAFEAAAVKDPPHAEALRAAGAKLTTVGACP